MKKNRNGNVIVLGIGLISLLILVGCAHSQITHSQLSKDDPSFSGADDFNKWVQNYYKNPAPELFYASMDYVNLNINKPDYHPLLMSFYGELFKKHPEKTIAWVSRVESWQLSDATDSLLWQSLKYSGLPQADQILKSRLDSSTGNRKKYIKSALELNPETNFWGVRINLPQDLDALWGKFFATGDKNNVIRIISSLERIPEKDKVEGAEALDALVGKAAEWSLLANSRQNPDVLKICKDELTQTSSSKIKKYLKKIIAEAEKAHHDEK